MAAIKRPGMIRADYSWIEMMSDLTTNTTRNAVLSLLEHIQARPGMFLLFQDGGRLAALETYLAGFDAACLIHDIPAWDLGQKFSEWLIHRHHFRRGGPTLSWSKLIELNCNNEDEAWELCLASLQEYLGKPLPCRTIRDGV